MLKLKLTNYLNGNHGKEITFAETETEHLDADFASAVLHTVSDDFLADLIATARKERRRRAEINGLNAQLANIMAQARESGIDLIDGNTGEILDGSYYFS